MASPQPPAGGGVGAGLTHPPPGQVAAVQRQLGSLRASPSSKGKGGGWRDSDAGLGMPWGQSLPGKGCWLTQQLQPPSPLPIRQHVSLLFCQKVVSNSVTAHRLQHAQPPCPSLSYSGFATNKTEVRLAGDPPPSTDQQAMSSPFQRGHCPLCPGQPTFWHMPGQTRPFMSALAIIRMVCSGPLRPSPGLLRV